MRRLPPRFPGACVVLLGAIVVTLLVFIYAYFAPRPDILPTIDADFSQTSDDNASIAALTSARLATPGEPPQSTLRILDATTGGERAAWTLGVQEFWVADPDNDAIAAGTWDDACYTHDVWTGAYSPGTPLTTYTARTFCF